MDKTVDHILSVLAVLFVVLWFVRSLRRGFNSGLVDITHRACEFREESVLSAVLVYLLGAMLFSGVAHAIFSDSADVRARLIVGNGAQIAGAIACLVIASRRFAGGAGVFVLGRAADLGRLAPATFVGFAIVALGLCPLVLDGTVVALRYFAAGREFPAHPTILDLSEGRVAFPVVVSLWLGACLVAPFAEEAFFRGILQTFVLKASRSRRTAIVVASLAFGLVHFQQPQAIPALVVLGVVLGLAYERSGSLIVPLVLHALFNLKTLVWFAVGGSVG